MLSIDKELTNYSITVPGICYFLLMGARERQIDTHIYYTPGIFFSYQVPGTRGFEKKHETGYEREAFTRETETTL